MNKVITKTQVTAAATGCQRLQSSFQNFKDFLIDEGVSCGKGANSVIGYLHLCLENYGLDEKHVILNAENCSGQKMIVTVKLEMFANK